eukprot:6952820-Prymnesium_polylepis.1
MNDFVCSLNRFSLTDCFSCWPCPAFPFGLPFFLPPMSTGTAQRAIGGGAEISGRLEVSTSAETPEHAVSASSSAAIKRGTAILTCDRAELSKSSWPLPAGTRVPGLTRRFY